MLLVTQAIHSMSQDNKNRYYNATAIMINLPSGLVGWVEAITCDYFLVYYGGHFWYDTSIPLCFVAFYFYARSCEAGEKIKTA